MPFYNLKYKEQPAGANMDGLHTHDFYEIEVLVAGERLLFLKNTFVCLHPTTLTIIKPGKSHKFESNGCSVYTLQISPSSLNEEQRYFLDFLSKQEIVKIPAARTTAIVKTLEQLQTVYNTVPFSGHRRMQFGILLGSLFFTIYKFAYALESDDFTHIADVPSSISPTILKIIDYIKQHYTENFSLDDLCNQFNISKSYLAVSFRKSTGATVFAYKLALQLEAAKKLCRQTRYSYDKIAAMTGFSSGNYFRLIFKKHEGETPKQHRYNSIEKLKAPRKS